jgi:hypothetical protein
MPSGSMINIHFMTINSGIQTIWETAVLVILIRGTWEVHNWDVLRWHDIHTKFHGNLFRLEFACAVEMGSGGMAIHKKTPWPQSASELYRPSDRRLSAKLVPTFLRIEGPRGVTNPYGRILDFLDWSRYYFFQVTPQLYSWGWVDPVPDTLLFFFPCSARELNPGPLDL